MENETVTIYCRHCGAKNRFPVEKALRDLAKPKCGSCSSGLLRVNGEPLTDLTIEDLAHPWDREALDKFRAVPLADKVVSKVFAATLDKLSRFYHLAAALRVNDRQAPRLWRLYLEAAGRLDVDPPPLFIRQSPIMNAYAAGAGDHFIVVTSGLLDGLEDREILGVLGHELTHVKLDHVLYQVVARLLITGGLGILNRLGIAAALLAKPIQLLLFRWYQMAELSGDRGELLATGSLETFIRAHMLLSGGSTRFIEEFDVGAFIDQAHDAEKMRDSDIVVWVMELLGSAERTHPLPAWRVHHGLKWARSKEFFEILAGRRHEKIES